MQARENNAYTTPRTTEAKRAVGGNINPIPPAICAIMRHTPMAVPKGKLQILVRLCHVSASCHMSAMTPNSTAAAPKKTRPNREAFRPMIWPPR